MKRIIKPSLVKGILTAPASKSSMQRACAAALIRRGASIIYNPGISDDDKAGVSVIQSLGATAEYGADGCLKIYSEKFLQSSAQITSVNNSESGLGIRMFTPIVALHKEEITINGKGSLLTRPMHFFDKIFPQLGVHITSNNGKLPLMVKGPLQPADIIVDGSLSSQFLTGLLFAYSASLPLEKEPVSIKVTNLTSRPYIDLTLKVMKDFGLPVPVNRNYEEFIFTNDLPAPHPAQLIEYTVEGDWSGGAFLLVAGAVAGSITVQGLDMNSTQADKKIMEALKDCGAIIQTRNNAISVSTPPEKCIAFQFDATNCPDLFPPLAVLAAYCNGVTSIKGVHRLTHKESNRALTIQEELGKMGVKIILDDDLMHIHGNNTVNGAAVHARHDHRIAMMCAVAALQANGETEIENAGAVNKSYPMFWNDIEKLCVTQEAER